MFLHGLHGEPIDRGDLLVLVTGQVQEINLLHAYAHSRQGAPYLRETLLRLQNPIRGRGGVHQMRIIRDLLDGLRRIGHDPLVSDLVDGEIADGPRQKLVPVSDFSVGVAAVFFEPQQSFLDQILAILGGSALTSAQAHQACEARDGTRHLGVGIFSARCSCREHFNLHQNQRGIALSLGKLRFPSAEVGFWGGSYVSEGIFLLFAVPGNLFDLSDCRLPDHRGGTLVSKAQPLESESLDTLQLQAYRLMRAGRFEEALPLAEQAVAAQRAVVPAHGMLATILLQLGRRQEAAAVVSTALECQPGTADDYDALAHVSMLLGDHERSNMLYQRVVTLAPQDPRFWYNLASSERSVGRLAEAEKACDRAIELDRAQYPSYLLRAELRVQSSETNHVEQLRSELARSDIDDRARMFLGYAIAKELDDLKQFDEAFRWLSEAARVRKKHLAYDVAADEHKLRRIEETFAGTPRSDALAADSQRYIFIVGLPRSGTTLLEHILLGLPGVRSNGETDNFSQAMLSAAAPGGVDIFARAAAADPSTVAVRYARLAGGIGNDKKIIDKLPMNYLYLGAIRRALPEARIVLVSRQPLDSCFAMYRTLFGEAYPFSYDFDDLARYYAAYDRLMSHWRKCLGQHLHEVRYEELVGNSAEISAGAAKYCGLQWNAQALEVQARSSVSLTASASQIRRPIYGSSSGRWRRYHTHLQPLLHKLRQLHISLPDDV